MMPNYIYSTGPDLKSLKGFHKVRLGSVRIVKVTLRSYFLTFKRSTYAHVPDIVWEKNCNDFFLSSNYFDLMVSRV